MSQLNPDAAEFVPISPTRAVNSPACRSLINETVLAQSPRRVPNEINDINLPNENEFASEIKSKPSELCSSNGHTTEAKLTSQEIMENFLNGKSNLDEIEFQPSTPKRGHNPEEFHFGPNATPFSTPAKMLDQSEAFSTKANFGDESTASYLDGKALESSFADTTAFGNEDNVDFQHLNKESDPMSMSFYQDKDDTRDPFDLNKVQVLPENLDDFLEKQDTVQQHFSEAEKLIDNKENIEMLVETTREVVENNAHNDLLDFCSMKPEEKQNDIEGICELPKSPVPTNDHLETSTPLPVATDSEDNFELHTAPAVCDLENRNSTNPFEMDMDMNKVEEEKGEKEDLQCEKEDIEKHRSEAESPNEEITSSVKDEIMSPVVSPAGKDLTEEISEAERDNSIASPELKELLSPVQKELKFEMENEKDIASPDITSPPAEEEIVEHECGLEAGVNYAQELTNAVQEALTTEISSPIPDNYAQSPVPSEPISEHEKVQDDLMACEFSAKKEDDLLVQKEEDIEPVCQLKPQEAFVETTPTDLSSPLKSDEDVLNKFEGEHMNLDIKTEFVQPEFPIQAIATPSETEDINQQFINQIKEDKPQDDFAACCSVLESAEDKVQEEQLIAEEVIAKTEEMVEKLVENDIIHPELMCEKVTTEDFRHDDRIEDNFVEEVKPPVEESKPVEEIKFEDEIKPVEEVKPVEEIKDVVEEEIKPVETVMQEEIKPVENIMQEEIKPVENIMQEEFKQVENIMQEEIKPVENIMQEEIKPVENIVQEEVKQVEEVKLAEEEIKTDVKVEELIADVCEKKVDEVVEQVCEKVAEVCEKVPEVCEKAPEVLPEVCEKVAEVCEKLPEVCSKPEEKIAEPKVEETKPAAAAVPLLAEKKADAKKVDDKKAAPKAKAPISKAKSVSSPTKTTATKSPLATKAATPKSAPATKASTPTAAKPLTKTASATKTSVTKTTTSTTAKTPTKPRTSLASRTTPSTSDKKPITNGDVKASPKTTTTTTPTAIKKTTTTTTRTSTLASAKPAAPKTSTDAKTSARPTSAPAAKATPPSRLSLGAAPKPRPTTLKPTPPKMSTNAAVKSTTVTRTTSLTSPKSTTAATTKPRTTTGLTARPKTTTTLSKTAPKAADSEKQIKDSVNKMTASKTTTSSRTSTSAGARTTTTVRKTETKTPATRTTTKTTVTTIKSAKKPVEIIRNPAKAKTTAINKDVQSPKENGISQTTVIEQITTTMVTSAEMEPQLLKDNSPVENNVILDNQIQEATIAD